MKLLIVDDEEGICLFLSLIAKECGWFPVTLTSPDEAVDLLSEDEFDAVLSDYRFNNSGLTGFHVLRHARCDRKAMMSGNDVETLALLKGYRFFKKPDIEGDVREWLSAKYD
jgi:CheY-like chemotaxis protein